MEEGYSPYNNDPTHTEQLEVDVVDIDTSKDHLKEALTEEVPEKKEWVDSGTRRSDKTHTREERYRKAA